MTKIGFASLLVATAMPSPSSRPANAYTQEQEAMCTNDAFPRL